MNSGNSACGTVMQSRFCELVHNSAINREIFRIDFVWDGPAPRAGQFFMLKPKRGSLFLGRPLSVALWEPAANTLKFLVVLRGKGTAELAGLHVGEEVELTGPLGNAWTDFLPAGKGKPVALVGGGIGIAPLAALIPEMPDIEFDFYAGFRTGFNNTEEKHGLLGPALDAGRIIIATEDGKEGLKGRIPDFLEAEKYRAVCACGPEPMLQAVAEKCKAAGTPCFVSLERRMACGVGACLGCTVSTVNGNRRCCADGPIFPAEELVFNG